MSVKLQIEHQLEFLSFKGGCTGLSEFTHAKTPHCWKSHVAAHMEFLSLKGGCTDVQAGQQVFLH